MTLFVILDSIFAEKRLKQYVNFIGRQWTLINLCHIVIYFSFSPTNIEALINKKDIFKLYISGAVEFGYTIWLLKLSEQ